jgi:hypothetical protein
MSKPQDYTLPPSEKFHNISKATEKKGKISNVKRKLK